MPARAAFDAVDKNDIEQLRMIAEKNTPLLYVLNGLSDTIAHVAVRHQKIEIVRFLLETAPALFGMENSCGKIPSQIHVNKRVNMVSFYLLF